LLILTFPYIDGIVIFRLLLYLQVDVVLGKFKDCFMWEGVEGDDSVKYWRFAAFFNQ
jgi:hypothetical protein